MLATVFGVSLVAQDRKVARTLEALPDDVRAVRVDWLSVGGQAEPYDRLDHRVRSALTPVLGREPIRTVLFRESTILGAFLGLGAVDRLQQWSVARTGRIPRACSPDHCEVLVLRGTGRIPSGDRLRLLPVGRGQLRSSTLFGDAIPPTKNAISEKALSPLLQKARRYHQAPPPPLVVANGVRGLISSARLRPFYRTYGWVSPINPRAVHPWSVDRLVTRIERMRATIQESSFGFEVDAPVDELTGAADSSRIAGRRLSLLGGEAAVLVLAFVIVLAARFRRDVDLLRQRLAWAGVPRWQTELTLAVQFVVVSLVGTLIGWALGIAVVGVAANRLDEPVGAVLTHSVLSGAGIAVFFGVVAGAAVALAAAAAVPPLRIAGRSVTPLDVAGIGAAVAIAVALGRGHADVDALLRERGTGVVLLLLPALAAVVAAAVVARTLPPALRAAARGVPKRATSVRLATLALARNPGAPSVAVAFLVLATGFAIFAQTYRSTLVRGEHDEAAFAVGADFVGREDPARLIPVQAVTTDKSLRALGPTVDARLASRNSASIAGAELVTGITVLGLTRSTLREMRGWRDDFGAVRPPELASRLAPPLPMSFRGTVLPRWARSLELSLRVRGRPVGISVAVAKRDGYFALVSLGRTSSANWRTLHAALPLDARRGRVVAIRFDPPIRVEETGAAAGAAAEATVELRPLRARAGRRTSTVSEYGQWIGTTGARILGRSGSLRADLSLSNQAATYVRPRQPSDGRDVRALVSRDLAALAGKHRRLSLAVAGEPMTLQVVGVASRFPGIVPGPNGSDFVVADRDTLVTALNASTPGAGLNNEIWVNAPTRPARERVAAKLRRPPFDVLAFDSRTQEAATLADDPIARASTRLLGAAAIAALALALLAVALGIASDVRDDANELFELEAQGLAPRDLRQHVRVRSAITVLAGIVGGIVLAVGLSLLVVDLVALAAGSVSPEPPLLVTTDWPLVSAVGIAALVAAAALAAAIASAAFRTESVGTARRQP